MGLELKDAQTRCAHTLEEKEACGGNVGCDFLGFTVRQFPVGKHQTTTHASYKTIIKPSKSSLVRHSQALATVIEGMKAATLEKGRQVINPKRVGWCNDYKTQVSQRVFGKVDTMLWQKMFEWAKRKHPKKSSKWVFDRDHKRRENAWRCAGKFTVLRKHKDTHIERHTLLTRDASPYDGNWSYWGTRRGKYVGLETTRGKLLKHQGGRCAHCQLFITVDDNVDIHHAEGNHKNRKLNTLRLLHLLCHDLVHGKGGKNAKREPITGRRAHDKSSTTEEPCAGKLASTVL